MGNKGRKPMAEQPAKEYVIARDIVCEEWQRAVAEFKLIPGSTTEKVVGRIINRLDDAATASAHR